MSILSKLYNALIADIRSTGFSDDAGPQMRCIFCTRKERLLRFDDINPGDHISLNGERIKFNFRGRQISPYTHHAIVKSVEIVTQDKSTAMVELIHFYTTPYDPTIQIQKTTEQLDLHYHEIHVIRYRHDKHTPDEVIARAEGLIELNKGAKYSVMSCNCEHFCNWCSVGNEESYQADSAKEVLKSLLAGVGNISGKILKAVCKVLLVSLEDLSKVASGALVGVPWGVLGVTAILFLVYTLYRHFKLNRDVKAGILCSACCRRRKQDLWSQFFSYCVLQVGGLGLMSLIISAGASGGIIAGSLIALCTLTLACIAAVPKLRKKFCSPFEGRLVKVRSIRNIWIGDVISFDHWKISHDGIVSSVQIYSNTRNKRGKISVVHYSLPTVFGTRTVVEETLEVDLGNQLILGHDYSGYKTHGPEIVVQRARQRIGETKFGIMTNRSCHFCHWAKVDENLNDDDLPVSSEPEQMLYYLASIDPGESISNLPCRSVHVDHRRGRKHATKSLGCHWARIRDEIKLGQIIAFKYRGFWHKAISTDVRYDADIVSKVSITVVHYGTQRKVCEENFSFDLNRQDVWIYKYHPLYRYRQENVIRRARARIGEGNYNLFRHRSSHLANEIVTKEVNKIVTEIDEIKPGDIITFYYWSFLHDAVVTKVDPGDSKPNRTGYLTIVHYALDHIFAVRTVKEESIQVDLKATIVYVKGYEGYVTYPSSTVVARARSRKGEQRFSVGGNTSSDLAHWAKVVQQPAIVAKSHGLLRSHDSIGDLHLLVPKSGKQVEEFQRFRANAWSDLYPGIIVEYRYYWIWHQGILSEKNEKPKQIKVIHYGAKHLFAKRTIMEDTMELDLRYDKIWIYRGHPKKCHKVDVVLANARSRLGEQRWSDGNRSWDFCKDCVLKNRAKDV